MDAARRGSGPAGGRLGPGAAQRGGGSAPDAARRAKRPSAEALQPGAAQREKAEKSVSALSQIAFTTWSGVSSCALWPVPVSSWNRASGMAAA